MRLVHGDRVLRLLEREHYAIEVEYLERGSGTVKTVQGRAFVVAAVAIETIEILMRSATPELPEGLSGSSGFLGPCIHDRPRQC